MITWTLVICTQAWGLCGHYREVGYENEQQCYKALDELYKRHHASEFKYVVCEPRKPKSVEGGNNATR
jgi:hypothetical protein